MIIVEGEWTYMDCIFCKIIEGHIPANVVYDNEHVLAFHDIQPATPVHILIIPKKHIPSMNDASGDDFAILGEVHRAAQHIARELGLDKTGYRLVNNCGTDSGQIVFHIHHHLIGGRELGYFTTPTSEL